MKKHSIIIGIVLLVGSVVLSCETDTKENTSTANAQQESEVKKQSKQLNITFLLDLSDRIEPTKYPNTPEHWKRDMAAVNVFVELFKNEMEKKGVYNAKGRMKVLFSPAPNDPSINKIAEKLDVDLKSIKPAQKKLVHDNIEQNFIENLRQIYDKTLDTKNYIGSDIWRFFKNDVKDLVIDNDPNYRNILVVITDGYVYHANTKIKEQNRYSYILPQTARSLGINRSDWKEKMEQKDFGLIVPCKDLNNLEVLILEINPSKSSSAYEEDILKAVLSKWFVEMGIAKFEIYKTDIPNTTKQRIFNFMRD